MQNFLIFFIPNTVNYKFLLINQKKYLYCYNKFFSFSILLHTYYSFVLCKSANIWIIKIKNSFEKKILEKSINNLCRSWTKLFLKKLKFTGKGYRIVFIKKKKKLKLYFNRAHITFIKLKKIQLKKIKKKKILLLSSNLKLLNNITNKIKNIRPINLYTKRGLKISRQKIFKKFSKKISTT